MHQNRRKKLITVLLAGFFVLLSGLLSGCSGGPVSASGDPGPGAEDAAANSGSVHPAASAGDILITEIMGRNHATLQDQDGDFPDWVELRNMSGRDINLEGWSLSDREKRAGLVFPAYMLPKDGCFVVFASGKVRRTCTRLLPCPPGKSCT